MYEYTGTYRRSGVNVRDNGGLNEETAELVLATTDDNLAAGLDTALDELGDALALELRDLRALEGGGVVGVAGLDLGGAGLEGVEELVVDGVLDVRAGTGSADLAGRVRDLYVLCCTHPELK